MITMNAVLLTRGLHPQRQLQQQVQPPWKAQKKAPTPLPNWIIPPSPPKKKKSIHRAARTLTLSSFYLSYLIKILLVSYMGTVYLQILHNC